jgi:hypothetical protein
VDELIVKMPSSDRQLGQAGIVNVPLATVVSPFVSAYVSVWGPD